MVRNKSKSCGNICICLVCCHCVQRCYHTDITLTIKSWHFQWFFISSTKVVHNLHMQPYQALIPSHASMEEEDCCLCNLLTLLQIHSYLTYFISQLIKLHNFDQSKWVALQSSLSCLPYTVM